MEATLTFLGTGTSMGVPTLGCDCAVCASAVSPDGDPRNRRTRPSLSLAYNGHIVLVDTGPDFHAQAFRENIRHIDAVLYTHGHADHVMGLTISGPSASAEGELPGLRRRRDCENHRTHLRLHLSARKRYPPAPAFRSIPSMKLSGSRDRSLRRMLPTNSRHPRTAEITGYRFGSAAYLTDMSDIPPE